MPFCGTMLTSRRKLEFDRLEIVENVGVVELDVVDHEQLGQVMDELRALVEKRGVVFVALDHEMLRVVEERALAKIARQYRR